MIAVTRAPLHDGAGRLVTLPSPVRRVVSLAPSSTEILFALGAGDLVVGVDRYSDYPTAVKSLAQVGTDVDPSLERIVGLRPDVVFAATTANKQATIDALERLGVPVYVSRANSLEEIYRDIGGIGDAVERGPAAQKLVDGMRARLTAARARCEGRPTTRALVVVWTEPLIVAGDASHVADLLAAACATNVADDTHQAFPTYSLERVVSHAPEALIIGTHNQTPEGGDAPLAALERLTTVPAVRDHRLLSVDGALLFRPGPRVVDGVEQLSRLLSRDR